eukprot:2236490-Prymnesium_polylepis.1
MWANSLLVFSGDNGGYLGNGGDNTPLRAHAAGIAAAAHFFWLHIPSMLSSLPLGARGVRVPAFATGGIIPLALRGTASRAHVHVADWAATFLELAGG